MAPWRATVRFSCSTSEPVGSSGLPGAWNSAGGKAAGGRAGGAGQVGVQQAQAPCAHAGQRCPCSRPAGLGSGKRSAARHCTALATAQRQPCVMAPRWLAYEGLLLVRAVDHHGACGCGGARAGGRAARLLLRPPSLEPGATSQRAQRGTHSQARRSQLEARAPQNSAAWRSAAWHSAPTTSDGSSKSTKVRLARTRPCRPHVVVRVMLAPTNSTVTEP